MRVVRPDGLVVICGQLGKRQHVFAHVVSSLLMRDRYHDLWIWDRRKGANERRDSLTPCYEHLLVLRKSDHVKFRKERIRIPYTPEKIKSYLKNARYKDKVARRKHLKAGKFATNILAVPSVKGHKSEQVGHETQKPLALIS